MIIDAAGDARNTTASATSSGWTWRPAGIFAPYPSTMSPSSIRTPSVPSTSPADTLLTRMPRGANSTARYTVSDSSAPFDTPTGAYFGR
jgi:hypothetical protein